MYGYVTGRCQIGRGGTAADTFKFVASDFGHNRIKDFRAGVKFSVDADNRVIFDSPFQAISTGTCPVSRLYRGGIE
jgi:hypothetical protein